MVKGLEQGLEISGVVLLEKTGGKTPYRRGLGDRPRGPERGGPARRRGARRPVAPGDLRRAGVDRDRRAHAVPRPRRPARVRRRPAAGLGRVRHLDLRGARGAAPHRGSGPRLRPLGGRDRRRPGRLRRGGPRRARRLVEDLPRPRGGPAPCRIRVLTVRSAVLIVSTSVARREADDESGPLLAQRAEEAGAEVVAMEVVPDDYALIEDRIRHYVEAGIELVFTTGGTGFTPDDVTPEATRAVIEREAPGLSEAMRAASLKHTPMGM